jgi:hypothetical protein
LKLYGFPVKGTTGAGGVASLVERYRGLVGEWGKKMIKGFYLNNIFIRKTIRR